MLIIGYSGPFGIQKPNKQTNKIQNKEQVDQSDLKKTPYFDVSKFDCPVDQMTVTSNIDLKENLLRMKHLQSHDTY